MKVSCLMPTFNRPAGRMNLLSESVASFLDQDYADKELLIGNDCPEQRLICEAPNVRVINYDQRFSTLGAKIGDLAELAHGSLLCRWDDDDYSLPHRLSLSVSKLGESFEWRPCNYWWFQQRAADDAREVQRPGNTHVMAMWRYGVLDKIGGYPNTTGDEDQAFNLALAREGISQMPGETLSPPKIYYFYRWGVSPTHLSGGGGRRNELDASYLRIGQRERPEGKFQIIPQRWRIPRRYTLHGGSVLKFSVAIQ